MVEAKDFCVFILKIIRQKNDRHEIINPAIKPYTGILQLHVFSWIGLSGMKDAKRRI